MRQVVPPRSSSPPAPDVHRPLSSSGMRHNSPFNLPRWKAPPCRAAAICEAAQRPTMRFEAVKNEEQQTSALVFRARELGYPVRS